MLSLSATFLAAGFAMPPNQTQPSPVRSRPDETIVPPILYSQPIVNLEQAARDDFKSELANRLDLPLGTAGIRLGVGTSTTTAHISTLPGSSSHVARRLSFPSAHREGEQPSRGRRRLNPSLEETPPWAPRSALILPDEVARRTGHRTLESTPDRPVVPRSMKPVEERRQGARALLLEDTKPFCYQCKCTLCPTLTQTASSNTETCPGKECLGKCMALYGCAKCTSGDDTHNPPKYVWVNGYFLTEDDYLGMASAQLSELWQQPWLMGVSQAEYGMPVAGQVAHTWNSLNPCPLSRRYRAEEPEGDSDLPAGLTGRRLTEGQPFCGTSDGLDLTESHMIAAADSNIVAMGLAMELEGKGEEDGLPGRTAVTGGAAPVCAVEYFEESLEIATKLILESQGAAQGLTDDELTALETSFLATAEDAFADYASMILVASAKAYSDNNPAQTIANTLLVENSAPYLTSRPETYANIGIAVCYDQYPYEYQDSCPGR